VAAEEREAAARAAATEAGATEEEEMKLKRYLIEAQVEAQQARSYEDSLRVDVSKERARAKAAKAAEAAKAAKAAEAAAEVETVVAAGEARDAARDAAKLILKLRKILKQVEIDESSFIKAIKRLTIPYLDKLMTIPNLDKLMTIPNIMSHQHREEISNILKEKPELETTSKSRLLSELQALKDRSVLDSIKIKSFVFSTQNNELKQLYNIGYDDSVKLIPELVVILENLQESFIKYLQDKLRKDELRPNSGGKRRRTKRRRIKRRRTKRH
jgi:hypothetical protein